jgi:hypothetical protein
MVRCDLVCPVLGRVIHSVESGKHFVSQIVDFRFGFGDFIFARVFLRARAEEAEERYVSTASRSPSSATLFADRIGHMGAAFA